MKSHLDFKRGKYLAHTHQWIISANTRTRRSFKNVFVSSAWLLEGANKGYFKY